MPRQQATLYHFNIGQPALGNGTIVLQSNERRLGPLRVPDETMASESVGYAVRGSRGECTVRTPRCVLAYSWDAATLPYLQLWQRLNVGSPILSIEPCTSERLAGGLSGEEPLLMPGECRHYELSISLDDPEVEV